MGFLGCVYSALEAFEVSHHGSHHTTGKTATDQKRGHLGVGRIDPVSEEVVDEFLGQPSHFHVCVHVEILYGKAICLHHLSYGNHIGMDFAP